MSRKLLDKARRRLAAEKGGIIHPWGGRLTVALIYPNRYSHAMSNLGYLTVHHLLNARDDTLCERFFLPDPEDIAEHQKTGYPLFSLESGRPLADFDLIAVSLSFENDALHLPLIFELGRIPLWATERGADDPLLLCGGVCAFLNPSPLPGSSTSLPSARRKSSLIPSSPSCRRRTTVRGRNCCNAWPSSPASTSRLSMTSLTMRTAPSPP